MRNKRKKEIVALLAGVLCFSFVGAAYDNNRPYNFQGYPGNYPQGGQKEENGGLVENTEIQPSKRDTTVDNHYDSNAELYLDALNRDFSEKQEFVPVNRGTYTATVSLAAEKEFPLRTEYVTSFPYGDIYFDGIVPNTGETPYYEAGDVLAKVHVEVNSLELERLELRVKRMEERGQTAGFFDYLKQMVEDMKAASTRTDIVIEESGYLMDYDYAMRGSKIDSYRYVIADPSERLLSVTNQNNQFRYGMRVTVTGTVDMKKVTGTGTVISASSRLLSDELNEQKAYIRLDEEFSNLYDAKDVKITAESIRMENALFVDSGAIFNENGAQMVYVRDKSGVHATGVVCGRSSSNQCWVLDGVDENCEVLIR